MDKDTLDIIKAKIILLRGCESPDLIATTRLEIATYMYNVGQALVESEMAFKEELSQIMRDKDWPAAKAKVEAEGGQSYKAFITYKQLYRDMGNVVSSARTKLDILKDQRFG